jgi:hypothetical protein
MNISPLALVVSVVAASPTFAAESCDDPVSVASRLYLSSYHFYLDNPPKNLLTDRFYSILMRSIACNKRTEGICYLGYNPWVGDQFSTIDSKPKFTFVAGGSSLIGWVQMNYINNSNPSHSKVMMRLLQQNGGCWRIDDFVAPNGESLSDALSD